MISIRLAALVLSFPPLTGGGDAVLPSGIAEDVRSTYAEAARAVSAGDSQLALALYEGVLLEGGVTVAVDKSTLDGPHQEKAVTEALTVWKGVLGDDFPVAFAPEGARPNVTVQFVDSLPEGAESLGKINFGRSYRWNSKKRSVSYSGVIKIVRTVDGTPLKLDEVRDVMMHEIGHLLGLADTENTGTLMGGMLRSSPAQAPSQSEAADVVALRRLTRAKIRAIR